MSYYFLNKRGQKCNFNRILINYLESKNKRPAIFLDANVCIDLERMEKGKLIDRERHYRLYDIINLFIDNRISVMYHTAMHEICIDKNAFKTDPHKWEEVDKAISGALKFSYYANADKQSHFGNLNNLIPEIDEAISNIVRLSYATNLKIVQLFISSRKTKKYYESLLEFIEWTENDLDYISSFGGYMAGDLLASKRPRFSGMLGADKNFSGILKTCMGSAFDYYISGQYLRHANFIDKSDIELYFCTSDENMSNIISSMRHSLYYQAVDANTEIVYEFSLPLDRLSTEKQMIVRDKLYNLAVRRAQSEKIADKNILSISNLTFIIEKLENEIRELKNSA